MSFVHRSIRMAVLSAPSQKASIIALAFRAASAVVSDAFQIICSGTFSASSSTSIFIEDCRITKNLARRKLALNCRFGEIPYGRLYSVPDPGGGSIPVRQPCMRQGLSDEGTAQAFILI